MKQKVQKYKQYYNKKNDIFTKLKNMNDDILKDKNKVKEYNNSLNKIINNKNIEKTKNLLKNNNILKYRLDIIMSGRIFWYLK